MSSPLGLPQPFMAVPSCLPDRLTYAPVIVMTLGGGGGRGPGTDQGKFVILKNRMANFPWWDRSDMTNV